MRRVAMMVLLSAVFAAAGTGAAGAGMKYSGDSGKGREGWLTAYSKGDLEFSFQGAKDQHYADARMAIVRSMNYPENG